MKQPFILFRRGEVFYCEDTTTRKQSSLRTKDSTEAKALLHARNESVRQPILNLQLARTYLSATDPEAATRTWQAPMDELIKNKTDATRPRYERAMMDRAFDMIRNVAILETHSAQFLKVLAAGGVATNVFLRRIHNFALDMNWLPRPVLVKKQWPNVRFKDKRAITWEEHQAILARERNQEWRAFYALLWHVGGSQTDVANLQAEDVDWKLRVISYSRKKTGTMSHLRFGDEVAAILRSLPTSGFLFPKLAPIHEKHRAKEFKRRCQSLGIQGVTLHSYRYAWAERAVEAGYPERFAMQALGHSSKAVHRAYAKRAQVTLPPLEDYEKRMAESSVILPLPLAAA